MNSMFSLIKKVLWDKDEKIELIQEDTLQELQNHALVSLFIPILQSLPMHEHLREKWKKLCVLQIAHNAKCRYLEKTIQTDIPYVILKGTAAAQYYPYPEFRSLGDIDLMVKHEDFESMCSSLVENGYKECFEKEKNEFGRHRIFSKDGIIVEVHHFFALLNDEKKAKYLDDLIIHNINSTHLLPDLINGLVIIEHINQHFEEGIGFRQIIDWMLFVDRCLSDCQWATFYPMVEKLGLTKITMITTRMCEMFLGLKPHEWCKDVNEKLCILLKDYVFSSGNFGRKRNNINSPGINVLTYVHTPVGFFCLLQERGLINWKKAQKYAFLKPFAWLYQICRYLKNGFTRDSAIKKFVCEVKAARERMALFETFGVKQTSKGLAVFHNGKYSIKHKRP